MNFQNDGVLQNWYQDQNDQLSQEDLFAAFIYMLVSLMSVVKKSLLWRSMT